MVMQIRRTSTAGAAGEPTNLQPGQLSVQMVVAAPKLWVGVPAAVGAPANRLLLAEGRVLTGGLVINENTGNLPAPVPATTTSIHIGAANGQAAHVYIDAFGNGAGIHFRRANNTLASPTTLVDGDQLGFLTFHGHDGSAYSGGQAAIAVYASGGWSSIPANRGTEIRFFTTLRNQTTQEPRMVLQAGLTIGSPAVPAAPGMQPGDLNVQRLYVNGQPLSAPGSYLALSGGTLYNSQQATGWGQGPLIVEAAGSGVTNTFAEIVLRIRSGPYAFSVGTTPANHFAIHNVNANNDPLTIWGGNEAATGSVFINRNGLVVGAPNNGSMGVGTLNVQNGIYIDGQPLSAPGSYLALSGGTISGTSPGTLTINRNPAPPPPVVGAASAPLHIIGNDNENPVMQFCAFNSLCALRLVRANGTGAEPAGINSGDGLGNFAWEGYWSTTVPPAGGWAPASARISAIALENFTDVAQGTMVQIATTPIGQNTTQIQATFGPDLRLHQGNLDLYNPNVDWQYITRSAARPHLAFCADDGQWLGNFRVECHNSYFTGNVWGEGQIQYNRVVAFDGERPGHAAGDNPLMVYADAGHLARIEYYVGGQTVWQVGEGAAGNWTIGEGQSQNGTFMARMAVFRNDAGRYIDFNSNNAYVVFNTPIYAHNGTTLYGHLWVNGDDGLHVDSFGGSQWARITFANYQGLWRIGCDGNGNFGVADDGHGVGYRFQIDRAWGRIYMAGVVDVYNGLSVHSGNLYLPGALVAHANTGGVEAHGGLTAYGGQVVHGGLTATSALDVHGHTDLRAVYVHGALTAWSTLDVRGHTDLRGTSVHGVLSAVGSDASGYGLSTGYGIWCNGRMDVVGNLTVHANFSCNHVTTNEVYVSGGTSSFHNLAARWDMSVGHILTSSTELIANGPVTCNNHGVHIYSGRLWLANRIDVYSSGGTGYLTGYWVVNGDFYVNGQIGAAAGLSDIRAKRDIEDWTGGLAIIEQLRPVQYHLIHDGQFRHGLVAQEVEPLLPEAVYECSFNGMKHIEYNEITTALVDAVRELSERLKAAEDTIHRLTRSIH